LNQPDYGLGSVVYSLMGRDKGRYFAVVGLVDESYVLIADGDLRRLNNPKKKKIKHLQSKPDKLENIMIKLQSNQKVFDSELRSALESLGYNNQA